MPGVSCVPEATFICRTCHATKPKLDRWPGGKSCYSCMTPMHPIPDVEAHRKRIANGEALACELRWKLARMETLVERWKRHLAAQVSG